MSAEIITIGDEILIGQIVDTNSAWLGQHLNDMGIKVVQITSVQDDKQAIMESFDNAFRRADLVLVTGGLGPTKDDLTKFTLAEYFHSPLVRHQPTYDFLKEMMVARNMNFNELNQAQANVPECCTVLPNQNGTAPAMWFERDGKVLVSMPGVPFEMKRIVTEELFPRLRTHFKFESIVHKTAITYGIPESELALRIAPWENALPAYLKLAYLPNANNIRLRLSAYEVDHDRGLAEIDEQFEMLRNLIPGNFLGFEEATVDSVVAELLTARNETVSVAESCTGGTISARFTAMAGASAYLAGGVVAYSNSVKTAVLGVNTEDLALHGAVSREVAVQMAEGVRRVTGSTYGLSTTGIAGPDGGSETKPVGTVWMAVATPEGTYAEKRVFGKLRGQNIQRASSHTVNMLRKYLTGQPIGENGGVQPDAQTFG